jgi:hypothetical protein
MLIKLIFKIQKIIAILVFAGYSLINSQKTVNNPWRYPNKTFNYISSNGDFDSSCYYYSNVNYRYKFHNIEEKITKTISNHLQSDTFFIALINATKYSAQFNKYKYKGLNCLETIAIYSKNGSNVEILDQFSVYLKLSKRFNCLKKKGMKVQYIYNSNLEMLQIFETSVIQQFKNYSNCHTGFLNHIPLDGYTTYLFEVSKNKNNKLQIIDEKIIKIN